jgi:hypothetical protein
LLVTGIPVATASAAEAQHLKSYYHVFNSTNYTKSCYGNFTMPSDGVIMFTGNRLYSYSGSEQSLYFYLYKASDMNTVLWNCSTYDFAATETSYKRLIGLEAGEYYMEVRPSMYSSDFSSGQTSKFNFDFFYYPTNDYETEPNNEKAKADVMLLNQPVYGYADKSEDYYTINASKERVVRIKVYNYEALNAEAYVKFINASGTSETLSAYRAGAGKDHHYFDVVLKKGKNYINVTSPYKCQIDYGLEITDKVVIPTPVINNLKINGSKVEVSWNQLYGITGYEIWRKINRGNWELILSPGSNTIGFWQSGTNFNNTYQFKVRAYETIGGKKYYSEWSKIKALNPTPTNIKLSATSVTYNGKVRTPSVTVKNKNGVTLKKNTHYTVTYQSGRKNVGKYKVTITFKGDYSGKKTVYFTIKPKETKITGITALKGGLKVKLAAQKTQTTGYQVQYSRSKKFTSAKAVTVGSNKTTTVNLKNLSRNKTYYVRVRTYKTINGTRYYSGWSTYKYKKTK